MKQLITLLALIVLGSAAWLLGSRLSADALGMILGILAGVPTALLVLAAQRRTQPSDDRHYRQLPAPYQPPVVVYTTQPQPQRQSPRFHIVGETEEWDDGPIVARGRIEEW